MLKPIFITTCLFCNVLLFSQEKDTTFSLCDDGKTFPYYYPELSYEGGFWEVKKHYQQEYPINKLKGLKNNSGIITIQFKVNCKGQIGDFKLQQCDLNYQPTTLNKKITDYLLMKTKTLNSWIPAKDEDGNLVNSHKFFSFRIKEGVLIQILPK